MSKIQRLLAFDTAGSACSAAVWTEGAVVAERLETMARGHSERLLPMIQTVMAEAGEGFETLQGIAVTIGPGAFTGIRIGLAAARGLSLARHLPVLGLSSFEAVAGAVSREELGGRILAVVLESKRDDVYLQCFRDPAGAGTEARSVRPETLDREIPDGAILLAGDAVERAQAALGAGGRDVRVAGAARRTDSAVVARLAAARPETEWRDRAPQPIYLRAPDVTRPRPLRS